MGVLGLQARIVCPGPARVVGMAPCVGVLRGGAAVDASTSYAWSEPYTDYMAAVSREDFELTQEHTRELLVLPLAIGYRPHAAAGDHVFKVLSGSGGGGGGGSGGGGGGGGGIGRCPSCPGHPDPTFCHTAAGFPGTLVCVCARSPEDVCGTTFTDPNLLQRHVREAHPDASMHECSFCGAAFSWLAALAAHARLCGRVGWCGRRCEVEGHHGALDPGKAARAAMRSEHMVEQRVSYCGEADCAVDGHVRSSFVPPPTQSELRLYMASHLSGGGEGGGGGGGGTGGGEGGGGTAVQAGAGAAKRQKGPPPCHGGYFGCTIPSHLQEGVHISAKVADAFASFHVLNPEFGTRHGDPG